MQGDTVAIGEGAAMLLPGLRGSLCIGFSTNGNPLQVALFGAPQARLRVLLLCGQHGDERAVRRAVGEFLRDRADEVTRELPGVCFAVLADANPDGFRARQRTNAEGIDLNRDHLHLRAAETRVIHRFIAGWRPHLIVDLHNYPSRRRYLVRQNLRLALDVCLDYPSAPAAGFTANHPLSESLHAAMGGMAVRGGFHFGRYCLVDEDGAMRHGTPKLGDARNTLALRYGVPVVLLEARNPVRAEDAASRGGLRRAVVESCATILRWAWYHAAALVALQAGASAGDGVPLRYRRVRSAGKASIPVIDLSTGQRKSVRCTRYRADVIGRRTRPVPLAYAVPLECEGLMDLLGRQGFQFVAPGPLRRFAVQPAAVPVAAGEPLVAPEMRSLAGYAVFPCRQTGGRLLMLLLEPESAYLAGDGSGTPAVLRVLGPADEVGEQAGCLS